jgi:DNA-binding MarR family transcriptional regulator
MFEPHSQGNRTGPREELAQRSLERMFSIMRQIHREIIPGDIQLSPPQARLIFTIAHSKDLGISVKELAQKSHMTPGAITQFTDVLIKKELVRRETDPKDRRIVRLKVTPNAMTQMHKYQEAMLSAAARRFDDLSLEELKQLNALLAKIKIEPGISHGHHW